MMKFLMHNPSTAEITDIEIIKDVSDFLDIIGNIRCENYIINKDMFDQTFFDLSTRIAGEILQKVSNYNKRLAIIGDFSQIKSKALKDFIYESNKNKQVVFLSDINEALQLFVISN
jgi:hypothetical protein